jgi:cellulose synthase operon protein C
MPFISPLKTWRTTSARRRWNLKSGKGYWRYGAAASLLICSVLAIGGELAPWVQHLTSGQVIKALFRTVSMPGGSVPILRPPAETRPAIAAMIAGAPRKSTLYRLRAQEAETALDFTAAETDWKAYVQYAADRYAAQTELADFYHRRLQPRQELAVLTAAATTKDDPILRSNAQRGWSAFDRMAALIEREAIPDALADPVFRAWIARYPKEAAPWRKYIEHLAAKRKFDAAIVEIDNYGRAFPDDPDPLRLRAELEIKRGAPDAALASYDTAFQPLWSNELRTSYFGLLEKYGRLREFEARARTVLASNPADLNATARLFHYFHARNNIPAARRALLQYRMVKESGTQPWTKDELLTSAQLFERLPDVSEAARLYYALYSTPPAGGPHVERALYGLSHLLLTAPGQPIQFGSGDLSFYRDIATADPSPGFLNGILSLLLNWTGARFEYQSQNGKSAAYFHRAAAGRLEALLEQQFPKSDYRDSLRADLVSAYAAYGDNEEVLRAGREYLNLFPTGAARIPVAMRMADALARLNRTDEEFALYDQQLRDLAAKASQVPIGFMVQPAAPPPAPVANMNAASVPENRDEALSNENMDEEQSGADMEEESSGASMGEESSGENENEGFQVRRFFPPAGAPAKTGEHSSGARSEEYVRVLDKYLSRLMALKRPLDALRVYRTEIDRNPNDPGIYQRFAAFLEQNNMTGEIESVYARAIARFSDRSWYHKLARWYLRQKQSSELTKISREAVSVFSGAELEKYFSDIVSETHPDAVLYRQLNLYAHERFPEDLVFVNNLLDAYNRKETYNAAAAWRLYRQYWFYDQALRTRFFEQLSKEKRLNTELDQVRAANPGLTNGHAEQAIAGNPAAVQFAAEAEAWLGHFETAAPAMRALAEAYPGRNSLTGRATSIYRSLAAYDPSNTEIAVSLAGLGQRSNPRDRDLLARIGDICADRELFGRAGAYWERMTAAEPNRPEAYLDAATVYWDYFRYDDALRWIATARKKFDDTALFAFQAGAIYEAKRDYQGAVREYVAGALQAPGAADTRLIRMLNRPRVRDLIEKATIAALASNPSPRAVALRLSVLEAEQRRPDIEALLHERVEAEKSETELANLQETARRLGFERIQERACERRAAVTNDPVDKMRLTLAQAHLLESKKNLAGAARVVDSLYHEHSLVLGVIRGAVDFHKRNHQGAEAIDVLLDAAKHARPDLADQLTLEAATIATGAGKFDRARSLLSNLLAADPLRAEFNTAMADTYLQAKDDRGFSDYQLAVVQKLKQAKLAPAQRIERIAAIRRSLIGPFDRLRNPEGAVDQYIEVINSYPEDETLTKEASTYAVSHSQAARLTVFYRKAVNDAPRDYRWPLVLGRIETVMEDYPAAIADYERAIKARPDRADILEAKARLEERLMQFDESIKSYRRLYELAYRDPQWLIKAAELHARSGRASEAVNALKTAIIGARSETADADFDIAEKLESWHILAEAANFADRGASLDGDALFASAGHAVIYARIMTRARRTDAFLPRLGEHPGAAGRASQSGVQVFAGTYSVDAQAANAAGQVIAETYTPEEKVRFEQALRAQAARRDPALRDAVFMPFAQSAGLVGLESEWRLENMMASGAQLDAGFASLQSHRGVYEELGRLLEEYAARNSGRPSEANAFAHAARAFVAAGDIDGQIRVMKKAFSRNALSGDLLDRYLSLQASRSPEELPAIARGGGSDEIRNRAVQTSIKNENPQEAYAAIRSRSGSSSVWVKAYTALAGLYFDDRSPAVNFAFQSVLDTRTIGERLKTPLKPDSIITGAVWFYYGARYGDYLAAGRDDAAEDWLPAYLEGAPGSPDAYMDLGDFYEAAGQPTRAIAQFQSALQLDPDRGDAHNHIARVLWSQGKQPEAIASWKSALAAFLRIQSRGVRVPESYWGRLTETIGDIGKCHALGQLREEIAHLLGDYYQRNRQYRFSSLINSAVRASLTSGEGTGWLLELGRSMSDPFEILNALMSASNVSKQQRISLKSDEIRLLSQSAGAAFGDERGYIYNRVTSFRLELITMLLKAGDVKGATAEWDLLPAPPEKGSPYGGHQRDEVEIRLASRRGVLGSIFERYQSQPDSAPNDNDLKEIALALRRDRDEEGARAVLEFLYSREIRDWHLEPANFLGLAEVDLQRNHTAAATALLNRMTLASEEGFETLMPAADMLAKYGKMPEAADFFRRRIKGAPWDAEAKVKLARALPAGSAERDKLLAGVITDPQISYKLRAESALMTGPLAAMAGTELALLSAPLISPDAASKPYQVESRLEAARQSKDAGTRLRLCREALAIAPASDRVRLSALRAALESRRDSLALALESTQAQNRPEFPNEEERARFSGESWYENYRYGQAREASVVRQALLNDPERASIAESLAEAAERLNDLSSAKRHLSAAIDLLPPDQRDALAQKQKAIEAEIDRQAKNKARQPIIRNVIDQDRTVQTRIPGRLP